MKFSGWGGAHWPIFRPANPCPREGILHRTLRGERIRLLLIVGATSQPWTPLGRLPGETGQVHGAEVGAQVLQVRP